MNRKFTIFPLFLIISLFLFIVTVSYYVRANFEGNQESLPYYVGAPSSYSYIIDTNSTHYFAYNGTTGKLDFYSTSASAVINSALGNLTSGRTWQETVICKGNFTIDDTILVPSFVDLAIDGTWTAKNSLNKDIIANANPTTYNYVVTIRGVGHGCVIDGNNLNQGATSRGIYLRNPQNCPNLFENHKIPYPSAYFLKDLTVQHCYSACIFINMNGCSNGQVGLQNVNAWGTIQADTDAIYLQSFTDSFIEGGLFDGQTAQRYGIYIMGLYYSKVHPEFMNGDHLIENAYGLDFSCPLMDLGANAHTLTLSGVKYSNIHDIVFHIFGDGATTNDAIRLQEVWDQYNCTNNIFSNLYAGRCDGTGTRRYNYVVEETDNGQNYNIYSNINGADCASGAVRKLGANSKNCSDTIIGSVITS